MSDALAREARSKLIAIEGPSAAAWLIKSRSKALHTAGAFDVLINAGVEVPMWFSFAIDYLKSTGRWAVTRYVTAACTRVRVTWKKWQQWHPEARVVPLTKGGDA